MARPLKYFAGPEKGLKEMTDAEIDFIAHHICANYAAQAHGTGSMTLNVNQYGYTNIGAFTDTYRPDAIGSHPVGTGVTTSTYTFYQNRNANTTAPVRPVEYTATPEKGTIEQTDAALATNVFPRVTAYLAAQKLGAYVLQPSAPVTGTWISVATITDTAQSGNNTTSLWRCTSYTAPTAVRPLRVKTSAETPDAGTVGWIEMTDENLQTLYGKWTDYVNATGQGFYAAQNAAPVGGTWVQMSTQFTDTRQVVSGTSYTGTYAATYTGTYAGSREKTYTGTFAGSRQITYTGTFAGTRPYYYTGAYGQFYSGFARGYFSGSYVRYYGTNYQTNFTGTYSASYQTNYTGTYSAGYSGGYAGSRQNSYTGLTVQGTKENVSNINLWLRTA